MQRLMPVPIPAYGKEKMALLNKKLLRGNDVPASISLTVNPSGSVPGLWISTLLSDSMTLTNVKNYSIG